ncbi:MAG: TVP38/TMEM64 family protein [Luteolibacter sp.]
MEILKKLLRDRRFHRLAGVMLVLCVGAALLAWKLGFDASILKAAWKDTESFLVLHPWLLFAGLVILPALPIPTSALLLLAGTVWRERPLMACAVCLLAMALNMSWTYWLAAHLGRGLVVKLISMMGFGIPELPKGNDLRAILLIRLTPGFPFFLQNYLLGFFRVPFRLYLLVSMLCNGLFTVGIVLSGVGLGDGKIVPVLSGLGLIVLGVLVTQWVRSWLAGRKEKITS